MNKLLIFVNKFDENDDLLGFFVGWAEELTQHLNNVIIVTQHIGKYEQIPRLKVILIDKNQIPDPIKRAIKFISLLFQLKNDYNGVLVIMAPGWVIVASLMTKILGKKLYLWYAVWRGNWKLRLAGKLVDKIFCSVPEAFPFKTAKLIPVGQGIDTDFFKPDEAKCQSNKVLYLGRISPVKKIEFLLQAIAKLKYYDTMMYHSILLEIVGGVANEGDEKYILRLKKITEELEISKKIVWAGRIPHGATKHYYQRADIVVNMTPTGSFDKTMLEAMASGALVLSSNRVWLKFFDEFLQKLLLFHQDDSHDLAKKLLAVMNLKPEIKAELRNKLRNIIVNHHSQKQWAWNIIKNL